MQIEFRGRNIGGVQEYEIVKDDKSIGYISRNPLTTLWLLRLDGFDLENFKSCEEAREAAKHKLTKND